MNELTGPKAVDASGNNNDGEYEPGVAFYLEGSGLAGFRNQEPINRAVHFAGGRMKASRPDLVKQYSVEMWFWNGLPYDARAVTGYMFSRDINQVKGSPGDHLGIGGTHLQNKSAGKLFFCKGDELDQVLFGKTAIPLKTWTYVVLVRDGDQVTLYLNGHPEPEIDAQVGDNYPAGTEQIFIGGRCDNLFNFEGKINEVAVYNRPLNAQEVAKHYAASQAPL